MKRSIALFSQSLLAAGVLAAALGCEPPPFRLGEPFFCDDVVADECVQPGPEGGVYRFFAPESKRKSWRDLGYYMYFHSRQTPGLRVAWNRPLAPADRARLEKSLHCSYVLQKGDRKVSGELEGRRIDETGRGLWCFDYLGTMLIEFHKQAGSLESPPAADFFPVTLTLRFETHLSELRGEKTGPIFVRWAEESSP